MKVRRYRYEKRRNVTFIEVIIGITLLALIGTVSFVKLDLSNYKINSFIKQMTTDIRYIRQINKIGNEKVYMLFMEEGRQSKKVFLPKGIELACPTSKILFNTKGGFYKGGTTITIIKKDNYTDITIVPTSGRILIKEGIYK